MDMPHDYMEMRLPCRSIWIWSDYRYFRINYLEELWSAWTRDHLMHQKSSTVGREHRAFHQTHTKCQDMLTAQRNWQKMMTCMTGVTDDMG